MLTGGNGRCRELGMVRGWREARAAKLRVGRCIGWGHARPQGPRVRDWILPSVWWEVIEF